MLPPIAHVCVLLQRMSKKLDSIKAPVAREMEEFEHKFRASMKTRVMLLDKIMTYIVKRKGKQMRPLFVFLSAGATGTISESTYRGAALIELLHTATLVHDDVVDDSDYRRGFFFCKCVVEKQDCRFGGRFFAFARYGAFAGE